MENETYVGDLDAVVGDDDVGYSLAPGSRRSSRGWDDIDRTDVGPFLKKTGMIIISRIGGTSGPMWGTAFLKAGVSAGSSGDKTLLDVLAPMTDRIEQELQAGAPSAQVVSAAAETARQAAEATGELVAMRGWASYSLMAAPKGLLLLLLNNYMGHRMAFDMSKERAKSEGPAGQGLAVV